MAEKIDIYDLDYKKRLQSVGGWNIPAEERMRLLDFLDELELGKVNKGVKISEARRCKYLSVLRAPLEFFGKACPNLTVQDIESFEKALSSGAIESKRGRAYSHATKVDMRRALKVYLRWRVGAQAGNELTDWLDTRSVSKTPDFLKEADIERLLKACKSADERFLISVLLDSGARATEFHNIRYEDIQVPTTEQGYVKLTLREEYSKTKGRTISLFWKHTGEAVKEFLKERELNGIRAADPIFTRTYDAGRLFLNRLGQKVLGRSVHYHLFRHSSATYYADKMNRQQLCIRYGWAFSSDMPDVYISRAGVDSAELDQKFANVEGAAMAERLAKAEQREKVKDLRIEFLEQQMKHLETTIREIQENFKTMAGVVAKNPPKVEVRRLMGAKRRSSMNSGSRAKLSLR